MAINENEKAYTRKIANESLNDSEEESNSGQRKGITVINPSKNAQGNERKLNQDDFILYANLTAEQTPRNRVVDSKKKRVINIANNRNVNFLNPEAQDGSSKGKLTTDYTKIFYENEPYDSETFGIESISIKTNASMVPEVDIEFIDIRGENLWARANDPDNPYNLFLTFPYPLFYLTVKGYLGEGMSMPLVLKQTNTAFSGQDGNFRTTASFQSWTFAMLNDVIMQYAAVVPYMYKLENDEKFGYEGMKQLDKIYQRQKNSEKYGSGKRNISLRNISGSTSPLTMADMIQGIQNISKEIENKKITAEIIDETKTIQEIRDKISSLSEEITIRFSKLQPIENSSKRRLVGQNQDSNESESVKSENYLISVLKSYKSDLNEISTDLVDEIEKIIDGNFLPEDIFNPDDEDDDTIVTKTNFDNNINQIYSAIAELITEKNSDFVNAATKELKGKIGYDPNISNVTRIICNNFQAFLELLANKSEKAVEQVLEDDLRKAQQNNSVGSDGVEVNKDSSSGEEIGYAWPEYWRPNDGLEKQYPGKYYPSWEENIFVEELLKAKKRLQSVLNVKKSQKKIVKKTGFNAFPFDHPLGEESRPYQDIQVDKIIEEVFLRASHSVIHDGYTFFLNEKQTSAAAREKGKLDALNLIEIVNEKEGEVQSISALEKINSKLKESNNSPMKNLKNIFLGDTSFIEIQSNIDNASNFQKEKILNNLQTKNLINKNLYSFVQRDSANSEFDKTISGHNYGLTEKAKDIYDKFNEAVTDFLSQNINGSIFNSNEFQKASPIDFSSALITIKSTYTDVSRNLTPNYRANTSTNLFDKQNRKDAFLKEAYAESKISEKISTRYNDFYVVNTPIKDKRLVDNKKLFN